MLFLMRKAQLFLVLLSHLGFCYMHNPQVCIKTGCLEGTIQQTYFEHRTICAYRGIPYAEPPERYKDSVPKKPWHGVLDATKDGSPCVQVESIKLGAPVKVIGSEDCLTCAVYTPHCPDANMQGGEYGSMNASLPVMVFFYPGAWSHDSNRQVNYGPEFMLNKDLILVVCNPRINVLGYLCTGDDAALGNWGFRDQVLALKWVRSNIQYFGGNPQKITLFGEATGASACTLHAESPLSKGLFQQSIAESGTSLYPLALKEPEDIVDSTERLAKLVDCPACPSEALVECMRTVPADKLITAQAGLATDGFPPNIQRPWGPTLDSTYNPNPTFPVDPRKENNAPAVIPLITGFVLNDGTDAVASILFNQTFEELVFENPKFYLPLILNLPYLFPKNTVPTVMDQVYLYYFGKQPLTRKLTQNLIDMLTDYQFMTTTIISALRQSKLGGDVWYFAYAYPTAATYNDVLLDPGTLPVRPSHGDNMLTLFPIPLYFPDRNYSVSDIEFISDRWNLWYNFAATGNPSGGNFRWNRIGSLDEYNLLILNLEFRQEVRFRADRLLFWIDLLRKYAPDLDLNL